MLIDYEGGYGFRKADLPDPFAGVQGFDQPSAPPPPPPDTNQWLGDMPGGGGVYRDPNSGQYWSQGTGWQAANPLSSPAGPDPSGNQWLMDHPDYGAIWQNPTASQLWTQNTGWVDPASYKSWTQDTGWKDPAVLEQERQAANRQFEENLRPPPEPTPLWPRLTPQSFLGADELQNYQNTARMQARTAMLNTLPRAIPEDYPGKGGPIPQYTNPYANMADAQLNTLNQHAAALRTYNDYPGLQDEFARRHPADAGSLSDMFARGVRDIGRGAADVVTSPIAGVREGPGAGLGQALGGLRESVGGAGSAGGAVFEAAHKAGQTAYGETAAGAHALADSQAGGRFGLPTAAIAKAVDPLGLFESGDAIHPGRSREKWAAYHSEIIQNIAESNAPGAAYLADLADVVMSAAENPLTFIGGPGGAASKLAKATGPAAPAINFLIEQGTPAAQIAAQATGRMATRAAQEELGITDPEVLTAIGLGAGLIGFFGANRAAPTMRSVAESPQARAVAGEMRANPERGSINLPGNNGWDVNPEDVAFGRSDTVPRLSDRPPGELRPIERTATPTSLVPSELSDADLTVAWKKADRMAAKADDWFEGPDRDVEHPAWAERAAAAKILGEDFARLDDEVSRRLSDPRSTIHKLFSDETAGLRLGPLADAADTAKGALERAHDATGNAIIGAADRVGDVEGAIKGGIGKVASPVSGAVSGIVDAITPDTVAAARAGLKFGKAVDELPLGVRGFADGVPELPTGLKVLNALRDIPGVQKLLVDNPKTAKYTGLMGVKDDATARVIDKVGEEVRRVAANDAHDAEAFAVAAHKLFKVGRDGRVGTLVEKPFFADMMENLGKYRDRMTPDQVQVTSELSQILERWYTRGESAGLPLQRTAIGEGGFFYPRGHTGENLREEVARAVTPNRFAKGAKKPDTINPRDFVDLEAASQAGYSVADMRATPGPYIMQIGNKTAEATQADLLKPFGKKKSAFAPPEIRAAYEASVRDLSNIRARLATAEKKAKINTTAADELDKALADVNLRTPVGTGKMAGIPTVLKGQAAKASDLMNERYGRPSQEPVRIKMPVGAEKSAAAAGIQAVIDAIEKLVPDDVEKIQYLQGAIGRSYARLDTLAERGGDAAIKAAALKADMAKLKDNLYGEGGLAAKYKAAVERASPGSQGYVSINAGLPQTNGTYFPEALGNAMNRILSQDKAHHVGPFYTAVNGLLRTLNAGGDVSGLGVQGLLGLAKDPSAYGAALEVSTKGLLDPAAYGEYLLAFNRRARENGTLTSHEISQYARTAGSDTEFTSNWLMKVPGMKQAERNFIFIGDTLRNELFADTAESAKRMGRPLSEAEKHALGKTVERATGYSRNKPGGDLAELALFAPRFINAQIETIVKAASDGTIEGAYAREALLKLAGLGALLTVGVNTANGELQPEDYLLPFKGTPEMPDRQDWNPLGNMTVNPNFMRMRVAGRDFSAYGSLDSLIHATLALATGDAMYLARTKASPLAGALLDLIKGETFTGGDPKAPSEIGKRFLPFSAQTLIDEGWKAATIGSTGLKSAPMTPYEKQMDAAGGAYENYNPGYTKPEDVRNDPLFMKQWATANPEDKAAPSSEIGLKLAAIAAEYAPKSAVNDTAAMADKKTLGDWKDERKNIAYAKRNDTDKVLGGNEKDPAPEGTPARWLNDYYQTFADATDKDGHLNNDLLDEKMADWLTKNGKQALAYVREYNKEGDSPIERGYLDALSKLADDGYWTMQRYVGKVSTLTDPEISGLLSAALSARKYEKKYAKERVEDSADAIFLWMHDNGHANVKEITDVINANDQDYQNPTRVLYKLRNKPLMAWLDDNARYSNTQTAPQSLTRP